MSFFVYYGLAERTQIYRPACMASGKTAPFVAYVRFRAYAAGQMPHSIERQNSTIQ